MRRPPAPATATGNPLRPRAWASAGSVLGVWLPSLRCTLTGFATRRFLGMYHRLLYLPIVYKLVVADALLVGAAGAAGIWFSHSPLLMPSTRAVHEAILIGGLLTLVALACAANYLIVTAALSPLASLQRTVEAVRGGNLGARAPDTLVSDPMVELLRSTLNSMLERMARDQARLHSLSDGLIRAQEEERKRVARELHDEVGGITTALLAALQDLAGDHRPRAEMQRALSLAAEAAGAVRRVAYQMRPSVLDDLGLVPALESFAEDSCRCCQVEFQVGGLQQRLPRPVELALYRALREALSNVCRHAQAHHVKILLRQTEDQVEARVEDDGIGFDVERVLRTPEAAVGLLGMQERVALLGGTCHLDSQPGIGTRIVLRVPVA